MDAKGFSERQFVLFVAYYKKAMAFIFHPLYTFTVFSFKALPPFLFERRGESARKYYVVGGALRKKRERPSLFLALLLTEFSANGRSRNFLEKKAAESVLLSFAPLALIYNYTQLLSLEEQ